MSNVSPPAKPDCVLLPEPDRDLNHLPQGEGSVRRTVDGDLTTAEWYWPCSCGGTIYDPGSRTTYLTVVE